MIERIVDEIPRFFTWYNTIFFLQAMGITFALTLIGCGLGSVLGFALVYGRQTRGRLFTPIRVLIVGYVEIFRRIPFLVLLFIVLFTTEGFGVRVSFFGIALIAICVISTAYISEIIRAGFEAIHRNQWDAAEAMNFGRVATLRYVIMPQAWKVILPPAFAYFVMFIKDTALASQMGVLELTRVAKIFNDRGYSAFLTFGTCLLLYFILSYPLTRFGQRLERRLASSRNR